MPRLFVYPTEKATKPVVVLECEKLTKAQATVPAHISIESVKPGMVCCPGEGRQANRSTTYVVAATDPKKVGFSTIRFEKKEDQPAPPGPPEATNP